MPARDFADANALVAGGESGMGSWPAPRNGGDHPHLSGYPVWSGLILPRLPFAIIAAIGVPGW
jgi:hypothetical protein